MSKTSSEVKNRWNAKTYDDIRVRVRKDAELTADDIRQHAAGRGESVNAFILRAVAEQMKRDAGQLPD